MKFNFLCNDIECEVKKIFQIHECIFNRFSYIWKSEFSYIHDYCTFFLSPSIYSSNYLSIALDCMSLYVMKHLKAWEKDDYIRKLECKVQ